MANNTVFLFHDTRDSFESFNFDGSDFAGGDWNPGFSNVAGATANATHIYVLDTSPSPNIVRRWTLAQVRESANDITLNAADTYTGIVRFTINNPVLFSKRLTKSEIHEKIKTED